MSPMPPNWWTAGGCVAGCWPAIAGRGKAVSAAGGVRRLREARGPSRPKGRPCPCTTQTRIVEMKLFRKEKKIRRGRTKPPPSARGPSARVGTAERCTRTAVCRLYNTPPAEVREAWRLVGGAASLGWFLAHPILGTEPEDSGLYGAARAVQDTTGELFAALHKVFPCADHVRRALHAARWAR